MTCCGADSRDKIMFFVTENLKSERKLFLKCKSTESLLLLVVRITENLKCERKLFLKCKSTESLLLLVVQRQYIYMLSHHRLFGWKLLWIVA